MRTELSQASQGPCEFLRDDPRLQGTQADALQSRYPVDPFYQVKQGTVVPVAALHRSSLPVFHPIGA